MIRPFAILIFVLLSASAFAQKQVDKDTDWNWRDRGYIGLGIGGIGFGSHPQLGNYYSIGLTPMVGYMLVTNLSGGFAFEYQYTGYPDIKQKFTKYGWYPFLRYNIKQFFIQTDYDWYRLDNIYTPVEDKDIYTRFNVGIGYFSQGRGSSTANFLVSYDLAYTTPSQFNSPLQFRIFLTF